MKRTIIIKSLGLATLLIAPMANAESGNTFAHKSSTIGSGGGASSGGPFVLLGTIGQPDAAPVLTGGGFKLEPGFWSGLTIEQTAGAPVLKIKLLAEGLAVISWPVGANGFVLEETATAAPSNSWSVVPQSVVDAGGEHTITVPASGLVKCYRLRK